jgi:hypothetical protein
VRRGLFCLSETINQQTALREPSNINGLDHPGNQELVFGGDLAPQESAVHALVMVSISLWITFVQMWASAILVRTSAILQYCGQP